MFASTGRARSNLLYMSSVIVRPYESRDLQGLLDVISLTYNSGNPYEDTERILRDPVACVAERDGQIVGSFFAHPMTATRGPATLGCGGVAAVAVAPELRRGGVGSEMMRWGCRHMAELGMPLASLYAFREPFYRKAGYEVAGKRLRITVPSHRLPKGSEELDIRRLGPDDWEQLVPCYQSFAHQRSGVNTREKEYQWRRVLGENRPLVVYAFGDPVESYAVISHKVDFWSEQWVSEFVWSSRRGYESALGFFRQLGINKTAVAWYEPSDSPFFAQYLDQGIEVKVDRPVMFRVNDVTAALRALMPAETGSFSLRVVDDVLSENDGVWRIAFSPSGVEVERGGEEDLTLDVRQLSQAFLGEPSLAELLRHGLVPVRRAAAVQDALKLFTPLPVYCGDFF